MSTSNPPKNVLCPRCFCNLDISQCISVNLVVPALLSAPSVPIVLPVGGSAVHSSLPPATQQNNAPPPPPEPSTNTEPSEHKEDHTYGKHRRSDSSSSSFDSVFSDLPTDAEFAAKLQAVEDKYFSQKPSRMRDLPPPPPSSPPTEFSMTPSVIPSSSPSTESSLTLTGSDSLPSATRRWVVFHGRVPGVYTTS